MLVLVISTTVLIVTILVLFLYTPNTGTEVIAGKRNSMGFEPNIFEESKNFKKNRLEKFNNPNNLYSLIEGPVYTPLGTSVPFTPGDIPERINTNGISVNGESDGPKSMFMLAYNKYSPRCCPSTYSTSKGCICLTDKQKQFINNRGQ